MNLCIAQITESATEFENQVILLTSETKLGSSDRIMWHE